MPIPADISEQRTKFTRDHASVARQYRQRAGLVEEKPEPKAEKKAKRSKKSDDKE